MAPVAEEIWNVSAIIFRETLITYFPGFRIERGEGTLHSCLGLDHLPPALALIGCRRLCPPERTGAQCQV
jgi:hypothetical protein